MATRSLAIALSFALASRATPAHASDRPQSQPIVAHIAVSGDSSVQHPAVFVSDGSFVASPRTLEIGPSQPGIAMHRRMGRLDRPTQIIAQQCMAPCDVHVNQSSFQLGLAPSGYTPNRWVMIDGVQNNSRITASFQSRQTLRTAGIGAGLVTVLAGITLSVVGLAQLNKAGLDHHAQANGQGLFVAGMGVMGAGGIATLSFGFVRDRLDVSVQPRVATTQATTGSIH